MKHYSLNYLMPYKKAMQRALYNEGVNTENMEFSNIANLFYNRVVLRKYPEKRIPDNFFASRKALKQGIISNEPPFEKEAILKVGSGILSFFKKRKADKKARKSVIMMKNTDSPIYKKRRRKRIIQIVLVVIILVIVVLLFRK